MKKSLILLAVALAGMVASFSVADVAHRVVATWHRTRRWLADAARHVVGVLAPAGARWAEGPRRALLGAVRLRGRMFRRERVMLSPRWRMCPST